MYLMMSKTRENDNTFIITALSGTSKKFKVYRLLDCYAAKKIEFYNGVVLRSIRNFCLTFYMPTLADCL